MSTTIPTRKLADRQVGAVASGLMRMTVSPVQTPDSQAFEAMQTALSLGSDCWNSGAFYSMILDNKAANLQLIGRFCKAHPELKDKFFLSVKGGLNFPDLSANGNLDFLRKDCENINAQLGERKMDLYQMARVDKNVGIEQIMKNMLVLRDEGHFKYIGLSEVSAETIRKAVAIAPIAAVEVEYSPFFTEIETNGVLDACKEHGIAIMAYSPLGAGILSGHIKSRKDFKEGDMRAHFDRFSDENIAHNLQLVDKLKSIAAKKGITPAQLSISWILHQWEGIIPLPGSTRPAGVRESVEAAHVKLSDEELKEIRDVVDSAEIKGVRYINNPHVQGVLFG
ncbi:hypothetical protein JCM1840_000001 [Sporobolomyces johnsonii]